MAGESTGDVDVLQEARRQYSVRLRVGGDDRDIESHRRIDDSDGDPTIDGCGRGAHGDAGHTGITPEEGGAGPRRWRWDGVEGEEQRQGGTLGKGHRPCGISGHAVISLCTGRSRRRAVDAWIARVTLGCAHLLMLRAAETRQ